MRFWILISSMLFSTTLFAEAAPEVFTTKLLADVQRCKPFTPGTVTCESAPGTQVETVNIELSDCNATSCTGRFEREVTFNNVSYRFLVLVSRNDNQKDARYYVSLRVWQNSVEGKAAFSDIEIQDGEKMPSSHRLIAPRTFDVDGSTAETILYGASLVIGDRTKLD